jgi:SSS family solute:Na+ symporter
VDGGLRLDMNSLDYVILVLYFVTVLGVGIAARRAIRSCVGS